MTRHVFRDLTLALPGRNIQVRYATLLVEGVNGKPVRRAYWAFRDRTLEADQRSEIARSIELACLTDDQRRRASV